MGGKSDLKIGSGNIGHGKLEAKVTRKSEMAI